MAGYDQIFRDMHPPAVLDCPYGRRLELADLWPSEQEKFKQIVDATLRRES